ncbi:MAG: C1 family peptidase [Saprospiraceae bacterium]|nr:C1 family peptidase [Saprospiraceae bacterium]
MKKRIILYVALMALCFSLVGTINAQDGEKDKKEGYVFTVEKKIPVTSVKNQYRSGTCWSFSGLALLEAEMIRLGKDSVDLSEMFIVRNTYSDKAEKYVRMHGSLNFGGGGAANDVPDMIKKYGIVPESAYSGLVIGEENHIHGEMDQVLQAYVDNVIKNKNNKLTPVWHNGFNGILDAYLDAYPENFTYSGKTYTPKSFAKDVVGLNMDDYVLLTSYTHHPFYKPFIIEVPDNWSWGKTYNLPLNELMEVFDNAIKNDFCITWAADVGEKGFSWKNGVAIVPEENIEDMTDLERGKWDKLSKAEKDKLLYKFDKPGKEKEITQALRQKGFDNYETTDDHGLLICGTAKDQNGTKYYLVKNSWGTTGSPYQGFMYASESYVKYKTMSIMLHKDAIPKSISKKLGL